MVETRNSEEINLRDNKYIVLNAAGASAGDAVLSLDSDIPRTESQQCNNIQRGLPDLNKEHEKAASPDDVFTLFCTSSIPRQRDGDTYNVPPGSVLVAMDNWGTTSAHMRADLTCMPGKSGETSGRRGSAAKPKKIRPGPIWRGEQSLVTVFRHHFYHRARSIAIPGYAAYLEVKLHDRCPAWGEKGGAA